MPAKSLNIRNIFLIFRNVKNDIRLTYYLLKDPNVSFYLKLPVIFSFLYLILPFDLFSDYFIPGLGYVDDFVLITWAIRFFLNRVPNGIKQKY